MDNSLYKMFVVMALIFSAPITSFAQFSVGLQGGANLSKMDFTNNQSYRLTEIDHKQGFIGGIVLQFLGEKHAGIQAEINYSQRGWIENDTTGTDHLKISNQMDYLEMPILTYITIGGGNLHGLFNIGPYVGYGLNRKITTQNLSTGASEEEDYVFSDNKDNQFDFGLMVGAGIEYKLKYGKVSAEARYTVGLGDIDKEKFFKSEVSQFRIVTVLLRYTIPIGGAKT
jgi:hypothetical protein